jgi:hypothetical protein
MSARIRRRQDQIRRLVKMDLTHRRLYLLASPRRDGPRASRLWLACITPLGDKLERQKPGAWAALPRCEIGTMILLYNFEKRKQGAGND